MPKASVATEVVACATPVPVRLTDCGLFAAPSVIVRAAVSAPEIEGVKVMLMVQDAFVASDAPQVVADFEKSVAFVPLITLEERAIAPLVLFVRVTVFTALVLPIP